MVPMKNRPKRANLETPLTTAAAVIPIVAAKPGESAHAASVNEAKDVPAIITNNIFHAIL